MKKILLTTSMLVATAGMAAAEVVLSGSGRIGVVYYENDNVRDALNALDPDGVYGDNIRSTQIETRLRFNIDAKFLSDNGVLYGGRIRMQQQAGHGLPSGFGLTNDGADGNSSATLNAAQIYIKYEGWALEAGNSNTAYDSVALMYNSELGFVGVSAGDPRGSYYSYSSGPYGATGNGNRMGLFLGYSTGGLNARLSYVQPDQAFDNELLNEETGVSVDYTFDNITLAAAYVMDGNGFDNNDQFFLGAEYAFNDAGKVGLIYVNQDNDFYELANGDQTLGSTVTLYGSYLFGVTTVGAYIASNDGDVNEDDTAYGIGASYDLGGATLAGTVQTDFVGGTYADLGVNFSF